MRICFNDWEIVCHHQMENSGLFLRKGAFSFSPCWACVAYIMAENEGYGLPTRQYILVSVPKVRRASLEPNPVETIMSTTMGNNKTCYNNFPFSVPSELRVGTMDALYTLLDDLNKSDTYIESVLRKIGRQRLDLTKKDQRKDVTFMVSQTGTYFIYLYTFLACI